MTPEDIKKLPTPRTGAQRLAALVLELAEAVDNRVADIGGSRPELDILRDAVEIAERELKSGESITASPPSGYKLE